MGDQLIIAGFHRSGTSATAQLLHRAGLFLGQELLEANPSNPYGHFEDRDVVNLHTRILTDNERTWMIGGPFLPLLSERHWYMMRGLIEKRNVEHRLWGFKDPRVCMFLMPWKYLLPDAKLLLVYRHFSASTRSLKQRHSSDLFQGKGNELVHRRFWREPDLALRMWLAYNNALLAFARAHPGDTLAISIDMLRDGFPLVWALKQRWKFDLTEVPTAEVFDPGITTEWIGRQPVSDRTLIGRVDGTWRALEELGSRTETLLEKESTVATR